MGVTSPSRTILIDIESTSLHDALLQALGSRVQPRHARTPADAVDVVASLDPTVIVVGPVAPGEGSDDESVHQAIVERTRWWCEAAPVTGAFVVLVSDVAVFGDAVSPPPDEFTVPTPVDMPGRAWRAAEALVVAVGGAVVRQDSASADTASRAALVEVLTWALAGRHAGTWHVGGAGLHDLHTRVVRGARTVDTA